MATASPYLASRSEFERNFNLVAELLKDGRISFSLAASLATDGLTMIRRAPNGRINLLTVNESARSVANGLQQMLNLNHEF